MTAVGLGALVGPVIGGGLYDKVGFQMTCDFIASMCVSFTLIYFVLVFIPLQVKGKT